MITNRTCCAEAYELGRSDERLAPSGQDRKDPELNVWTVVCTYMVAGKPARLFYDACQARTPALAAVKIAAKCPQKPTDVLVFKGEVYDTGTEMPL